MLKGAILLGVICTLFVVVALADVDVPEYFNYDTPGARHDYHRSYKPRHPSYYPKSKGIRCCTNFRCLRWEDEDGIGFEGDDFDHDYWNKAKRPQCRHIQCAHKFFFDDIFDFGPIIDLSVGFGFKGHGDIGHGPGYGGKVDGYSRGDYGTHSSYDDHKGYDSKFQPHSGYGQKGHDGKFESHAGSGQSHGNYGSLGGNSGHGYNQGYSNQHRSDDVRPNYNARANEHAINHDSKVEPPVQHGGNVRAREPAVNHGSGPAQVMVQPAQQNTQPYPVPTVSTPANPPRPQGGGNSGSGPYTPPPNTPTSNYVPSNAPQQNYNAGRPPVYVASGPTSGPASGPASAGSSANRAPISGPAGALVDGFGPNPNDPYPGAPPIPELPPSARQGGMPRWPN